MLKQQEHHILSLYKILHKNGTKLNDLVLIFTLNLKTKGKKSVFVSIHVEDASSISPFFLVD